MARADTKGVISHRSVGSYLPVVSKEYEGLEEAIWMLQVAMHNVTFVAVFNDKRGRYFTIAREKTKKNRKKEYCNKYYAGHIV